MFPAVLSRGERVGLGLEQGPREPAGPFPVQQQLHPPRMSQRGLPPSPSQPAGLQATWPSRHVPISALTEPRTAQTRQGRDKMGRSCPNQPLYHKKVGDKK